MTENKDPKNDPGAGSHKQDEQLRDVEVVLDADTSDFVAITLRRDVAVDLLNALVISLGQVPNPPDTESEAFEQAGDSTVPSDI